MTKMYIMRIYQDDDFQLMMNSALRHALGRHTYVVRVTADYLRNKLMYFSNNTLIVMLEDLNQYFDVTVPLGKEFSCDIKAWKTLRETVQDEFKRRKDE